MSSLRTFKLPGLTEKASIIVVAVIILFAGLPGIYFFIKYKTMQSTVATAGQSADAEVKSLMDRVGKLMLLPAGETPTVATVSDITKLKDQAFFTYAENGDKVLIFQAAKKAILFRPADNRIIEVAPVNIGPSGTATESAQTASPSGSIKPTAAATVKVVLWNGTSVIGLTRKYDAVLKAKLPSAEVLDRDNAKNSDYEQSLLIDLTGTKAAQGKDIAAKLGLTVSKLAKDETPPAAGDFLIILGADYAGTGEKATPSAAPAE